MSWERTFFINKIKRPPTITFSSGHLLLIFYKADSQFFGHSLYRLPEPFTGINRGRFGLEGETVRPHTVSSQNVVRS